MKAILIAALVASATAARADSPETVVVTYSPQPGKEAEIEKLVRTHYATLVKLHLVTGDAHVTFRDKDADGKPVFVDVLTWKSHAAPDDAPPAVLAIWTQMQAAVEKRGERRGIEFHEVELLRR